MTEFILCTYNARTPLSNAPLEELGGEASKINFDVIGVAEVSKKDKKADGRPNCNCLFYQISPSGVGFCFSKEWRAMVISFSSHSPRIAQIKTMINRKTSMRLVQACAAHGVKLIRNARDFWMIWLP